MKTNEIIKEYLKAATLLRKEITLLRTIQRKTPAQAAEYENRIIFLFNEYNHLLDTACYFFKADEQEGNF